MVRTYTLDIVNGIKAKIGMPGTRLVLVGVVAA